MDTLIRLNNSTAGRDKTARLIQYLCKALWDTLDANDINSHLIDQLRTFELSLSTFRKTLRLGKCIDTFYASLTSLHYADAVVRMTVTLSKLASSMFLFCDHMIWFARTGFVKGVNVEKWNKLANKYWLFSVVMNLVRDFYEIQRLLATQTPKKATVDQGCLQEVISLPLQTVKCICGHKPVLWDTVKNACDLFLPLNGLGFTKLSPRTIGVLGFISSLAGLIPLVEPSAKLSPA
ncbi:peroxisomal membrane protein 11B [Phlebotomus argentipes]|uniref:peroxisomal membrane protein 11B n=1 Tax=Phlebotomus argentipes TaxID=94469 RepID=UPI0028934807|nr:peroxisomal membrane protein 11B [Phlebotomus argentipes]